MGYRKQPKFYRMTFEDHPGLEVVMRGLSVKGFTSLARLLTRLKDFDPAKLSGDDLTAGLDAMDALLDRFAARLQSWNLEDEDGNPVPATREGVGDLDDMEFILELVTEWMGAIASVDTPLSTPSPSTPPSGLGLSEATVPLSPSPGS